MKDIFISYRREDSSDIVGRIYDHLENRFGEGHIFKDVDSIPFGSDFRDVIRESVQGCKVLLAVIGNDWLWAAQENGSRRIDSPEDFVALEISAAIEAKIKVIPVLVENAVMPNATQLPERLKALAFKNAAPVRRDPDFHPDVIRLSNQIAAYVETRGIFRRQLKRFAFWVAAALVVPFAVISIGHQVGFAARTAPSESQASLHARDQELLNRYLLPLQQLLEETKNLHQELSGYDPETWGVLESYVLASRRDGPEKHAVFRNRIERLVETDRKIVTLLRDYRPAASSGFQKTLNEMIDHAERYIDRWEAVDSVIKSGDQLPHAKYFPEAFPDALKSEIELRRKSR